MRQRITINHHINPLTGKETGDYIRYRLKVAGSERVIFGSKAIQEIFTYSRGYPRVINIICDIALLTGYVKEISTIPAEIIQQCADELQIPSMPEEVKQKLPVPALPEEDQQKSLKPELKPAISREPMRLAVGGFLALLLIIADNETVAGRRANRRVEIEPVIPTSE